MLAFFIRYVGDFFLFRSIVELVLPLVAAVAGTSQNKINARPNWMGKFKGRLYLETVVGASDQQAQTYYGNLSTYHDTGDCL
jgi:hypothetical protein